MVRAMPTLHLPATRDEWLKLRHAHIGSTESAALFGLSQYATAYEIAVAKKSAEPADWEGNERTKWGQRLEASIATGIEADYGVLIEDMPRYAVHSETRMGSSFDFKIAALDDACYMDLLTDEVLRDMVSKHGPGVLEIKNVDSLIYKQQWSEEAPPHIEIQLQHQLECLGLKWGVIAALVGGNRTEIIVRERDEAVGRAIVAKVREFWANLEAGIMPPLSMPEDAAVLIRLHQFADPGKLYDGREDTTLANLCREYRAAADEESAAEKRKKVAHALILERIADAEKALVTGYSVSASMVAETEVHYTRKAYRSFRVTEKKAKANG